MTTSRRSIAAFSTAASPTPPSCGPDCHAGRVSGLQARSERAQLDPAECMTERALDLDLAG